MPINFQDYQRFISGVNRRMVLAQNSDIAQMPRILRGFEGTVEDLKEFFLLLEGGRII